MKKNLTNRPKTRTIFFGWRFPGKYVIIWKMDYKYHNIQIQKCQLGRPLANYIRCGEWVLPTPTPLLPQWYMRIQYGGLPGGVKRIKVYREPQRLWPGAIYISYIYILYIYLNRGSLTPLQGWRIYLYLYLYLLGDR